MIPEEVQLKILYFRGRKNDSSKQVRVLEPLHYLNKRGHKIFEMESAIASNTSQQVFKEMNTLLISNYDITPNNYDTFEKLAQFCHDSKKLIVCDFDDIYYDIEEPNPYRPRILPFDFLKKVITISNILTVTGSELVQTFKKYNSKISILPNMIDFKKYTPRPQLSKIFRIGLVGSINHLRNIPLITDAVRGLQAKYPFEFVVAGMFEDFQKLSEAAKAGLTDTPFLKEFLEFKKYFEGINCEVKPLVDSEHFPIELSRLDLDVGLCPIKDTVLNRCRSGLKSCQYASVNTLAVGSKVHPYREEPIILADNTTASWTQQLEKIITNKTFREDSVKLQYDYVLNHRNYEKNITQWERVYQIAYKNLFGRS
jgi:glycosyltransferase involved in cell wall biosynthesis